MSFVSDGFPSNTDSLCLRNDPAINMPAIRQVLRKSLILSPDKDQILIRYDLLRTPAPVTLILKPFLAFRNIHQLTHANNDVHTDYQTVENGVGFCMYNGYTPVYFQFSEATIYEHHPDWYYNIEYEEELKRGYDGHEDLWRPGTLTVKASGKELYLCIGTEPVKSSKIAALYEKEAAQHTPRYN